MRDQIHGVKRNWLTRLLWRIAWSTQSILMGLESLETGFSLRSSTSTHRDEFFWLSIWCKLFLNLTNQAFIFVANCKQITSSIFLENYFPRYLRYFRNTTCSPNPISVIPNISSLSVHPILIWRLDSKLRQCVTDFFTLFRLTRNSGLPDDVITLVRNLISEPT